VTVRFAAVTDAPCDVVVLVWKLPVMARADEAVGEAGAAAPLLSAALSVPIEFDNVSLIELVSADRAAAGDGAGAGPEAAEAGSLGVPFSVSAAATPAPFTSAAPTPNVMAPAPSQV
jgi:hypothetical protein